MKSSAAWRLLKLACCLVSLFLAVLATGGGGGGGPPAWTLSRRRPHAFGESRNFKKGAWLAAPLREQLEGDVDEADDEGDDKQEAEYEARDGLLAAGRAVGLRRIQRRPELVDPLEDKAVHEYEHEFPERALDRAVRPLIKRALGGGAPEHEFVYVVAPVSEQALAFQSERLAQGYRNFVPLAEPNYRTGLERLTPLTTLSALELQQQHPQEPQHQHRPALRQAAFLSHLFGHAGDRDTVALDLSAAGCRPVRSQVRLARDELDPTTGALVKRCTGLVELQSCEGHCRSSTEPSIKAPGGLLNRCICCNEGALRRVQVRLGECVLVGGYGGGEGGGRHSLVGAFMDVPVDEPIECRCRACASPV